MMRNGLISIAVLCALALAQDADTMLEQAAKLERAAEKLLDQGKRAEAFEALARAADLRERARRGAAPEAATPAPKTPEPRAKPQRERKPAKVDASKAAGRAVAGLERALATGDMDQAREAARGALAEFRRWERELAGRERKLAKQDGKADKREAPPRLLGRLEELEREVARLRRELEELR
jgi:hypothetical protein